MTVDAERPTLVIAGATGFVGEALARALAPRHRIIGLSRRAGPMGAVAAWRSCDLFNLREAEAGLAGAERAAYLVHSMLPSAHLTQGRFEDLDLICADNFGRAAARAGTKRILYLGGLAPAGGDLSPHLRSRVEVERVLASHGVPVTTVRAGLILGAGGSSFTILERLVRRLPVMLCPRWTLTRTQPIALDDLVALLAFALEDEGCAGGTFDVGAPDVTCYRDMMALCAELLGKRSRSLRVPLFSPGLSRLWVSSITGAPRALVAPLVQSLRHEMVARDRRLEERAGVRPRSVRTAMAEALAAPRGQPPLAFRQVAGRSGKTVRSVQRMTLPAGRDAEWAASEYVRWLPLALRTLIRAHTEPPRTVRFSLAVLGLELLVLTQDREGSAADRQLFFVTGGLLARPGRPGRFELRQVFDGRTLLTAVHDYRPRLPWPVYVATQARFHAWVMVSFRRHLARVARA